MVISGESSIVKGSKIGLNKRNQQDYSEVSFDDLQDRYEPFRIDNPIEQKDKMLQDSYINNPLLLERLKKMEKIKNSLGALEKKDILKANHNYLINEKDSKN